MLRWLIEFILAYFRKRPAPAPKPKPVPPKDLDFAGRIVFAMRHYGYPVEQNEPLIVYIKNVDRWGKPRPERGRYKYDDLRVVLHVDSNGKAVIDAAWDATVDPFFSVNNGGAAQITCPSHQTAWKPGWHLGREWALVQTGGQVEIDRDRNWNYVRDKGDERMKGWWGINQHSGNSAGCLTVPSAADQKDFMRMVERHSRYRADKAGYVFSTTILPAEAVQPGFPTAQ